MSDTLKKIYFVDDLELSPLATPTPVPEAPTG